MITPRKSFAEKLRYIFFPKDAKGLGFLDRLIMTTAIGADEAWAARADVPQEKQLIDMTAELAQKAQTSLPKVIVYKSPVRNAASIPGSVAVTSALLEQLPEEQIREALGHELSHHKHRVRDMAVSLGVPAAWLAGSYVAFPKLWKRAPGVKSKTALVAADAAGFITSFMVIPPIRRRASEFQADKESAEMTNRPDLMIDALHAVDPPEADGHYAKKKMSSWAKIRAPYPPMEERVERLKQMEASGQSALPSPPLSR